MSEPTPDRLALTFEFVRSKKGSFYDEDIKKNPTKEVSDLSKFLNKELSNQDISEIVDYLDFSNVKERATGERKKFFRKGIVGDGEHYFEGDNRKQWDDWVKKNIEGTDIKFTYSV